MATIYVDSNAGTLQYSNRTWTLGQKMVPSISDASANGKLVLWEVTTAGTSTGTPSWPASPVPDVTTVTQNTTTWTARSPDSWAKALPGLHWAVAHDTNRMAQPGDTIYMASNHSFFTGANLNFKFPINGNESIKVFSVDSTTGDYAPGAVEATSTSITMSLSGEAYIFGLEMRVGNNGSTGASIIYATTVESGIVFDNCTFWLRNTSANSRIQLGTSNAGAGMTRVLNCFYRFDGTSQAIAIAGSVEIRNFEPHASTLTVDRMFTDNVSGGVLIASSCDFSKCTNIFSASSGKGVRYNFSNCKMPVSFGTLPTVNSSGFVLEAMACGTTDHTYDYTYIDNRGSVIADTTAYRTNGAVINDQDGANYPFSLKMTPIATVSKNTPLISSWISIYNDTTGSRTLTVNLAYLNASLDLLDTECWIEVEYYAFTDNPMGVIAISAPNVPGSQSRDILVAGTIIPSASGTWTLPAGTQNIIALSKTVTVEQKGFMRVRVGLAKNQVIYVDPKPVLT